MTLLAPLATLPLSAPLPNGTMEIQCLPEAGGIIQHEESCFRVHGCCSNNGILGIAIVGFCRVPEPDTGGWQALTQYEINFQVALCHFDRHSADNVQLLLTPKASAILDSLNQQDEELRQQQAIYHALQTIGGELYRLGPASLLTRPTLPFIHSKQECLNQAALVSGTQAMNDTAMCALIVQLWFVFRAPIHGPRTTLLAAPYVALLAFSLLALSVRASRLIASQTSFCCMLLDTPTFLISQWSVLLSILIVTLIFDGCIIHILYRRWQFFQRSGGKALGVPLSVVFHVIIFCVYRIVFAVAYMATMLSGQRIYVLTGGTNEIGIAISEGGIFEPPTSFILVWADMLQAGTPLIAFLIFGTSIVGLVIPWLELLSQEFLNALMFWRWFNPILAISMCCCRRSPVTPRESNTHGKVVNHESVVSSDKALDIRQEMKSTDECFPL
ncbi:hypothetical protein JB92DRAFT_2965181 [Gautieria morchelliformis]|nr:hypothetical protein JB92DRAFT_2965181 [Gautieria morchelliformis]